MSNLKEFKLVFFSGFEITRHYDIEEVKKCYLNKEVRIKNGKLDLCISIKENNIL